MRPVHLCRCMQFGNFAGFQRQWFDHGKQTAVEIVDVFKQEFTAALHGLEQLAQTGGNFVRRVGAFRQNPLKKLVRQEIRIFCKHRKQTLNEEVGHFLRIVPTPGQCLRDLREAACCFRCDILHCSTGPEFFRVGKYPAQFLEVDRFANVLDSDGMHFRRCPGEVRMNLNQLPVTDDEQRRIIKRQGIGH